ncbi:HD domain-containing protein [Sediminivirga luteola]|nr:HD domain-containing protein [Sediminivirga luteola]
MVIEVPTGLGKTASIAVAVYELARQTHRRKVDQEAGREPAQRTAPQRIIHVVNRRTVVDDAGNYAKKLAVRINEPAEGSPLHPVRSALSALLGRGDETPVVATQLHGASPAEAAWLRASGCVIISMTPHQLVSRLLMRGFGVANGARPIHAALVGIDRLILMDEPHLAVPSINAIADADGLQRGAAEDLGVPLGGLSLLGATVPPAAAEAVGATPETTLRIDSRPVSEEPEESAIAEAARREHAHRRLLLHRLKGTGEGAFATALAGQAIKAKDAGASRVGVFVNTVSMAQQVYQILDAQQPQPGDRSELRLLTSRFRGLERPVVPEAPAGITVTTQALEVGVDISFDALVTELCSWDALVQRLGRLNRDGRRDRAEAHLVTGPEGRIRAGTQAVYGEDAEALENLLRQAVITGASTADGEGFDVSLRGVDALRALAEREGLVLNGQAQRVGTLHRGLVPLMVQTRPAPRPDLPVDPFIAGPDASRDQEVLVAWRSLLDRLDEPGATVPETEYVTLPRAQVMRFLRGERAGELSDLDLGMEEPPTGQGSEQVPYTAIRIWDPQAERWKRPESRTDLWRARALVLHTGIGGYAPRLGWTGSEEHAPVPDLSLAATVLHAREWFTNGKGTLPRGAELAVTAASLDGLEALLPRLGDEASAAVSAFRDDLAPHLEALRDTDEEFDPVVFESAAEHAATSALTLLAEMLPERPIAHRCRVTPVMASRAGIVLQVAWPLRYRGRRTGAAGEAVERRAISLRTHGKQVAVYARSDADAAGLSAHLAGLVLLGGRVHDVGKRDPRFQHYLRGDAEPTPSPDGGLSGSAVADLDSGDLLAKSDRSADRRGGSWVREQTLRRAAQLPDDWRHEAESVRILRDRAKALPCAEHLVPLLCHLVGAHHGNYRPGFPPVLSGREDFDDQVEGFSHAEEFLRLNDQYGPWGLAYLETLVRLADWRASAQPDPDVEVEPDPLEAPGPADEPVPTKKRDPAASTSTEQKRELRGLITHPLTGWFTVVGLLASALDLGDRDAAVQWDGGGNAGAPLVPVFSSRLPLETLVTNAVNTEKWRRGNELVASVLDVGKGLGRKNQKLPQVTKMRELLQRAAAEGHELVLGLVTDLPAATGEGEKAQVLLPIVPWPNNFSYPEVALKRAGRDDVVERMVAALLDPNAGYEPEPCDGGMDRAVAAVPLINGVGEAGSGRMTRAALAPLAVLGMARVGHAGGGPLGVIGSGEASKLRLPLPTRPTGFDELRALLMAVWTSPRWNWAAVDSAWVLEFRRLKKGDSDMSWQGGAVRRRGFVASLSESE